MRKCCIRLLSATIVKWAIKLVVLFAKEFSCREDALTTVQMVCSSPRAACTISRFHQKKFIYIKKSENIQEIFSNRYQHKHDSKPVRKHKEPWYHLKWSWHQWLRDLQRILKIYVTKVKKKKNSIGRVWGERRKMDISKFAGVWQFMELCYFLRLTSCSWRIEIPRFFFLRFSGEHAELCAVIHWSDLNTHAVDCRVKCGWDVERDIRKVDFCEKFGVVLSQGLHHKSEDLASRGNKLVNSLLISFIDKLKLDKGKKSV